MRADRLLSLLLLLRARGRMTASQLAAELEVSVRTVLRDVEALSAASVPVYAERGRSGGFALLPGYSTDLTGLTHAEATALLSAGSRATSASLGMAPALASAMRKLMVAMPASQRQSAERAAERVLVQPQGWLAEPEHEGALRVIQQAVFADRRLRISYPGSDGAARWRTVDPVGLVHAAGRWYLLALHDGADRTYRVSRVAAATILDQPAERRIGVELERLWQQRPVPPRPGRCDAAPGRGTCTGNRTLASRNCCRDLVEEAPHAGGWLLLDLVFADRRHAASALWALAPDAEVVHPQALRDSLGERAEQTLHRYGQR